MNAEGGGGVRALLPPRAALKLACLLTGALLVIAVLVAFVGGHESLVPCALGVVGGIGTATSSLARRVKVTVGALFVTVAGLGVLTTGHPVSAGVLVGAAALVQAPLNVRSDRVAVFAPVLASAFATAGISSSWVPAALWVGFGFAVIQGLAWVLRVPHTVQPLEAALARRHAVALAVAAGGIQVIVMPWGATHGYWVVLALAVVLRPVAGETRTAAHERTAGTILGVVLAATLVWAAPHAVALLWALPCVALMVAWEVSGSRRNAQVFGTPVLVLVGSSGAFSSGTIIAAERLTYTGVGVGVALIAVVAMERYETVELSRDNKPDAAQVS